MEQPCRIVTSPEDACLFVFSSDSLCLAAGRRRGCHVSTLRDWLTNQSKPFAWEQLDHWRHVGGVPGRHHVLLHPSNLRHGDQIGEFIGFGSTGEAIIVSPALWRGSWRPRHDVPFPPQLPSAVGAFLLGRRPAPGARRPFLVSFRGASLGKTVWYHARVATLAWAPPPTEDAPHELGVAVTGELFAKERKKCNLRARDPIAARHNYTELMEGSAYAFAPGGGGPFSYRFFEALAAGAVPVITDDMLIPLEGTRSRAATLLDACVVRVPLQAVAGLPDLLVRDAGRAAQGLHLRQRACAAAVQSLLSRSAGQGAERTAPLGMTRSVAEGFAGILWDEMNARLGRGS